ncbi:MAG: copper resistance protein CopC, partial [Catenulispora sp.]|nr:copper resistance protein CopC [Catenulispora sp.]
AATVVGAEAWRAHPQAAWDVGGAALTAVHLAAASVWAGALVFTLRVCASWRRQEAPKTARRLLAGYARLALWLVAAVVVTGVLSGLLVVPLSKLFTTGYGQVLLVKIALVGLAIAVAAAARNRLRRTGSTMPPRLGRFEAAVLAAVLAITAVLVTLPPPPRSSALTFAPPPDGPVLPLGARAGLIGISVQAWTGQVVLHLGVPESGVGTRFTAGAALTDPAGTTTPVALRGCGSGCFYAPLSWPTGTSVLSLDVAGPGWTGGHASLIVDWPGADGTAALRQVTANLAATKEITVTEHVTSDTTGPSSDKTLVIGGAAFLGAEPYGDGAPQARVMPAGPGRRLLALGYPAQDINVLLTIDDSGRILAETLTDATHLTIRAFDYPDQGA